MEILQMNKTDPERYPAVVARMRELGAPVIQVLALAPWVYFALEGSHRLAAAKELGLIPILDVVADMSDLTEEDDDQGILQQAERRRLKGLSIRFPAP